MKTYLNKTNEDINYLNYSNSSAVQWESTSAKSESLATLIRNHVIIIQLPEQKEQLISLKQKNEK